MSVVKPSLVLASILAAAGCAATSVRGGAGTAEDGVARSPQGAAPGRGAVVPQVPEERALFAEVLGPPPARRVAAALREAPRGSGVEVRIDVVRSAGPMVESVTAAIPGDGVPVVVRSGTGSGWSVALALAPSRPGGVPEARIAFDVSWTRPDGPPRFPAIPADAPRDAVPRDGSAGEVQFALQGTLTAGLRSLRDAEPGRPAALAVIPLGQEEVTFTVTVGPMGEGGARAVADVCEEHLAARLREILAAPPAGRPGRDVRTIELVHDGGDPAGFLCGTDATPGSRLAAAALPGNLGAGTRFAAADLGAPGSAAYLVRDAAWVTDYEMRDGRVAPVVARRRSGFAWLRDADGVTLSESVVLRSTTPRPVTLADGRTLWADVLRAAPGPRVVTSGEVDDVFAAVGATSSR